LRVNQKYSKNGAHLLNFTASAQPLLINYVARNGPSGLFKSLLSAFEYNNSLMGKKSFVRIVVGSKQYRLNRSDITRTHFIKKRVVPRVPSFFMGAKHDDFSLELENTSFYDVCFKREESSEDECEVEAVELCEREGWNINIDLLSVFLSYAIQWLSFVSVLSNLVSAWCFLLNVRWIAVVLKGIEI